METFTALTKTGKKTISLNYDEDICFNCECITTDDSSIPTNDSAVNFCRDCFETYYCLHCGKPLDEGETMYHIECQPKSVVLNDL